MGYLDYLMEKLAEGYKSPQASGKESASKQKVPDSNEPITITRQSLSNMEGSEPFINFLDGIELLRNR